MDEQTTTLADDEIQPVQDQEFAPVAADTDGDDTDTTDGDAADADADDSDSDSDDL